METANVLMVYAQEYYGKIINGKTEVIRRRKAKGP